MRKDQSRFKYSVPAIMFVIVALLAFAQAASTQPAVFASDDLDENMPAKAVPIIDSCEITVHVQGGGSVNSLDTGGESELLTAATNELQASCGEVVELTAVPDPLSRFIYWQGVPEEIQSKFTITVSSPAVVTAVFAPREILRYETLEVPYIDRDGQPVTEVPIMESVWRSLTGTKEVDTSPPTIDVWYGSSQSFGQFGTPQKWVNILGNVADDDGDLSKLEYRLNGDSAITLSVGGDGHRGDGLRLYRQGDFNIDIDKVSLTNGPNSVLIIATDSENQQTTSSVTINYASGNTWPLPYGINWGTASSIQNVAQIVDGDWGFTSAGVRLKPDRTGFDRIIALGDMSTWSDFELTVPVTVHGYDPAGFSGSQVAPALGLVMRWKGHTTTPDLCDQPLCGYYPIGATAWYEFKNKDSEDGQFSIWSQQWNPTMDTTNFTLNWGETYIWKVRSQTLEGTTGRFKMKVWPVSGTEPDDWLVTKDGMYDSYLEGSVLLLTHHVDVTFGDVNVVPYDAVVGPPEISGVQVISEPHGATVRWFTDEPAKSRIDFGTTSAYGRTINNTNHATTHSLYLPGLDPKKSYHFKITATDFSNESVSTEDDVFETQELISLVSDDFNTCSLDQDWIFINPLGDSSYELNGNQIMIDVPAGANHDIWPPLPPGPPVNRAPRLMRAVTDPNNLKVKFDSSVDVEIGLQGILVEQDDQNFLRINYQYENGQLILVVVGFETGVGPKLISKVTVNGAGSDGPLYLLLTRPGGQWLVRYSIDDENWTNVGPFTFPLSVTQAGIFAGNSGNEPAFKTSVDYYFDANNPIVPEDGDPLLLPVQIVGNGSVSRNPTCGNPVTLTAHADPGWHFVQWLGSPIHGNTSLVVTTPFESGDEVAVLFEVGEPQKYLLDVQKTGQGTVVQDPDKSEYIAGEVVMLTAEPVDGWRFDSWGEALTGTDPEQSITMDSDKTVIANFIQDELSLDVTVIGPGQVQLNPQGPYRQGDEVTLTAVPVGKYAAFIGWTGDINSSDNPLKVIMSEDTALTANFTIYKQFLPFTAKPVSN